jgi:hypothetical protein
LALSIVPPNCGVFVPPVLVAAFAYERSVALSDRMKSRQGLGRRPKHLRLASAGMNGAFKVCKINVLLKYHKV